MEKRTKDILVAIFVIALSLTGALVAASTYITAPEHESNNPIDRPTPTPTPTPAPTHELHLSSNNTNPFYKGDTLHLIATLTPATEGVIVTLYNNGNVITTATTDADGVACFDRICQNPFDFTVTAEIP